MATTIRFNALDSASVASAITKLQRIHSEQKQAIQDVCMDLASIGATRASIDFARVPYQGIKDVSVSVDASEFGAKIVASGESVLFLEYGSGAKYGYGHPDPKFYGPGTWNPTSPHYDDPDGWYLPKEKRTYKGEKSWGNPPAQAMWNAQQVVKDEAESRGFQVTVTDGD